MVYLKVVLGNNPGNCGDTQRLLSTLNEELMSYMVTFAASEEAERWWSEANFGSTDHPQLYVVTSEGKAIWGATKPSVDDIEEAIRVRDQEIGMMVRKTFERS